MMLLVAILTGEKIPAPLYEDVSLKELLDVCDKYDLQTVQELILSRHVIQPLSITGTAVWDCFCIAARNHNLPAAKRLISQMGRIVHFKRPREDLTDAMMNQCPRAYLVELFHQIGCLRPQGDGYVTNWQAIADRFQPR